NATRVTAPEPGKAPAFEDLGKCFVTALAYPPDGRELVSSGGDGAVRVWNAESGELLRTIPHGAAIIAIAVSPDGTKVASAGDDKSVRVFGLDDGALLSTFPSAGAEVGSIAFSLDSAQII